MQNVPKHADFSKSGTDRGRRHCHSGRRVPTGSAMARAASLSLNRLARPRFFLRHSLTAGYVGFRVVAPNPTGSRPGAAAGISYPWVPAAVAFTRHLAAVQSREHADRVGIAGMGRRFVSTTDACLRGLAASLPPQLAGSRPPSGTTRPRRDCQARAAALIAAARATAGLPDYLCAGGRCLAFLRQKRRPR
jgi:hypothetical protein